MISPAFENRKQSLFLITSITTQFEDYDIEMNDLDNTMIHNAVNVPCLLS